VALKQDLVGRPVVHERPERLLGVEHDQVAVMTRAGDVDQMRAERVHNGGGVVWRGDDNRRLSGGQPFAEEGADGGEQLSLITIELHGVMTMMEALVGHRHFHGGQHSTPYRQVRRDLWLSYVFPEKTL